MDINIKNRVLEIMSEHLGVKRSELTDGASLTNIMDELDLVELIMALEEEFGVELPDDIEETVAGSVNPVEQFFMDSLEGKFDGMPEEEVSKKLEEASKRKIDIPQEITVGRFLDIVAPYLP